MVPPGLDDLMASGGQERLLRAIEETAFAHLSSLSSHAIMERLASIVGEALGARAVIVRRYDPQHDVMEAVATWGIPIKDLPFVTLPSERDIAGRLYSVRDITVVHTAEHPDDTVLRTLRERVGIETGVVVPLRVEDEYIGSLRIVFTERRTFRPEEMALMAAVADRVALALHHAEILEREQRSRRQAEALLAIAQAGLASTPLEETLANLTKTIRQSLGEDTSVVIRLWNEERQGLVLGAADPPTVPNWTRPPVLPLDSFAGRVFREKRPLVLADIHAHAEASRFFAPTFRSTLGVPLLGQEQPLGVLSAAWSTPHTPTPQEQALLEIASALAGQAIVQAQSLAKEQATRRRAEALLKIAQAGLAYAPLEEVLQSLAREIAQALEADRVIIRLWNEREQHLELAALAPKLLSSTLRPRHLHSEQTFSLQVFQERRTVPLPDIAQDPIARTTFDPIFVSTLGTPIPNGAQPLGVIHCDWTTPHTPTRYDQALLEMAARLASQAIQKTRALEQEREARRLAEALGKVLEAGTSPAPLPQVLQSILESIVAYWQAHGGIVRLLDKATNTLVAVACVGYRLEDLPSLATDGSEGGSSPFIFTERKTGVFRPEDMARRRSLVLQHGYRLMLGAPLTLQGEAIGVIHIEWKEERPLSQEDVERFTLMVRTASQAVERAWLYEQAQQQARTLAEANQTLTLHATILSQVSEGVAATDTEGRILYWSPGFERLTGIAAKDALGRSVWTLARCPEDQWQECVQKVTQGGERTATRSIRFPTPAGQTLWLDIVLSPWYQEGEKDLKGFILVARDATPLRQLEMQLLQLEKMRALGQMAAGVAHDFNNFLAIIMGQAELALMDRSLPPRLRHSLEAIRRASVDGAQVVRRLASLARMRSEGQPEPVDVHKVCQEALESTRFSWEERAARLGITITPALDLQEVPPAACTEPELREVLVNLILNAVDAMPQGGNLTLACYQKEGLVCVAVKDTGTGIPPNVLEHLFEPFFTTKGPKGTGLGLAVSYSIVKRYGGDILVETEVGKGSTFTVRLPVAKAPTETATPQEKAPTPGRSLRLLVVEDDPFVANLLGDMLSSLGHRPQVIQDPAKALEAFTAQEWDGVITDLAMPALTGWDVASYTKKARPNIPVILLTGYGDHINPHEAKAHGVDKVLGKPISPKDLAAALQAIFEGSGIKALR